MNAISRNTVVELHELCLDICPFSTGNREAVCPRCPLFRCSVDKQWRFAFGDALKLIKEWTTFCGKQLPQ
jgi:hypothetical protein